MVAAERESGEKGGEGFADIFILFTSEAKTRFNKISVKHKNHFSMPVSSALTMYLHSPLAVYIPQSPA